MDWIADVHADAPLLDVQVGGGFVEHVHVRLLDHHDADREPAQGEDRGCKIEIEFVRRNATKSTNYNQPSPLSPVPPFIAPASYLPLELPPGELVHLAVLDVPQLHLVHDPLPQLSLVLLSEGVCGCGCGGFRGRVHRSGR